MTNYKFAQGESFNILISIENDEGKREPLGNPPSSHNYFFHGTAKKGNEIVDIQFKYAPLTTEDGVESAYFINAYIPADNNGDNTKPDTLGMEAGTWQYVIRESAFQNPTGDNAVNIVISGELEVKALIDDLGTDPENFNFTPAEFNA